MTARVVAIVRGAARLEALTYEVRPPADPGRPWEAAPVCEPRPLPPASRPELWAAWCALEAVTAWDGATLERVLAVLRGTVPAPGDGGELPALGPEVHPAAPPRATAAHPRAYRGTRHRPPRPPRPEPVDVRPYLLARRHIDQVLEQLGQPRGIDPYLAWHLGGEAIAGLEPAFVVHVLPLLHGCSGGQVGAFAALARALELHLAPNLRAALVGVLLDGGDPARALGWWTHVLAHDAPARLAAARLVCAAGLPPVDPIDPAAAARIAALPLELQWACYRGYARGAAPAYLLSGIELDAITARAGDEPPAGTRDVAAIVRATVARLEGAMAEDSGAAFWRPHLWRLCGEQPELVELLGSADFGALRPPAAFWLLRLAGSPRWTPETAAAEWRVLAPWLVLLARAAAGLAPDYHRKLVEDAADAYWCASDAEHDLAEALEGSLALALRAARPPFATAAAIGGVLPFLALAGRARWAALRDAPDASWRALEDACRRDNDARLLRRGVNRLARFAPALLVSAFAGAPGALVAAADALASISFEAARRLVVDFTASPLGDPALAEAPLERLCALVTAVARAGGPDPVRRALRRHLAGENALSEAQVSGHRARIVAALDEVRLAALRQAVERELAARVGIERIESPGVRHAAAILGSVDVHRRQLRRLLAASLAGDRTWRLRHPRTAAWLARHPKLDWERWLAGIETRSRIAGVGDVRLAVETDPLEALQLGTYVGSCLGRGGGLAYSAAAVVLDVNKHVVYARDAKGAVAGRQLVAISEQDELVCFGIYGAARAALEPAFRDFDRAFAAALGLPLHDPRPAADATYEIAPILAHEWWDDSPWDGVMDP